MTDPTFSPGIYRVSRRSWTKINVVHVKWIRWLMTPEGIAHRERFLARMEFLDREEARLRSQSMNGTPRHFSLGRLLS